MVQQVILQEGAFQRTVRDAVNANFLEIYNMLTGKAPIIPNPAAFFPTAVSNVSGTTLNGLAVTGGLIYRTGPTANFTDTTDTATAIYSGTSGSFPVGTSQGLFYWNNTAFTATISGGTGITFSGGNTVPPYSMAYYQIAFSSLTAATITKIVINSIFAPLPNVLIATADNGTTQTLTAAMVTGGATTVHVSTGGATPSLTMPTAAAIIAAIPGFGVGNSFTLRIINSNSGIATMVTNTGITTSGTLTLAAGSFRDFAIQMTGAATLTMTSMGTGTTS